MKITGFVLLLLLSGFTLFLNFELPVPGSLVIRDSVVTASIAVVGDLMCHSVQFNYARKGIDSFDFNPVYRYVSEIISSADFAFGNLETVTAGSKKKYSGYPFFNSPDEYIPALKNAGFDLLTTANNHSLDQGEQGVNRTIENITLSGMGYNGTFTSHRDRDSVRIVNLNGIKIAMLAYTYGTNGIPIPKDKPYLVNLIDSLIIKKDIQKSKLLKPDLILVHFHFGDEYSRKPSLFQRKIVDKTIEYGADIIIGGHPHVIQEAEFFKGHNNLDSAFVIYSMGNFISNQRKRYTDAGVILNIKLSKNINSDSVMIETIFITPTWVFKGKTNNGNEYVVMPHSRTGLPDLILSAEDKRKMQEAFDDTKSILLTNPKIRIN